MTVESTENRIEYYDWLLVAMGAAVVLGAAASFHPSVTVTAGLRVGGAVATLVLYQALFRRPPELTVNRRTAAVVVWHCVVFGQFAVW